MKIIVGTINTINFIILQPIEIKIMSHSCSPKLNVTDLFKTEFASVHFKSRNQSKVQKGLSVVIDSRLLIRNSLENADEHQIPWEMMRRGDEDWKVNKCNEG